MVTSTIPKIEKRKPSTISGRILKIANAPAIMINEDVIVEGSGISQNKPETISEEYYER